MSVVLVGISARAFLSFFLSFDSTRTFHTKPLCVFYQPDRNTGAAMPELRTNLSDHTSNLYQQLIPATYMYIPAALGSTRVPGTSLRPPYIPAAAAITVALPITKVVLLASRKAYSYTYVPPTARKINKIRFDKRFLSFHSREG